MTSLAWHFEAGSWGMYPILACSIAMLAASLLAITRLWAARPDVEILLAEMDRALALGDVEAAIALAQTAGRAAGRIALAGLRECLESGSRVESAVACAIALEHPRLRAGQAVLWTTTQLATLFGLFGTITGLSTGFGHGAADATSRACMLARGISESMNCNAFGLLVSTCSLLVASLAHARAEELRRELDWLGRGVVNRITSHRDALRWLGKRAQNERPTYRVAA